MNEEFEHHRNYMGETIHKTNLCFVYLTEMYNGFVGKFYGTNMETDYITLDIRAIYFLIGCFKSIVIQIQYNFINNQCAFFFVKVPR